MQAARVATSQRLKSEMNGQLLESSASSAVPNPYVRVQKRRDHLYASISSSGGTRKKLCLLAQKVVP
jgi:hypothetical protein